MMRKMAAYALGFWLKMVDESKDMDVLGWTLDELGLNLEFNPPRLVEWIYAPLRGFELDLTHQVRDRIYAPIGVFVWVLLTTLSQALG